MKNDKNTNFRKMPQWRKRVAIARDVLAQLGKRLYAEQGSYLSAPTLQDLPPSAQLQPHFAKMESCTVCALGAMFVCVVDKVNAITAEDAFMAGGRIGGKINRDYLNRYFSSDQLARIETAFEKHTFNAAREVLSSDAIAEAIAFAPDVRDASTRLRLIMENIVANKGIFVPSKQPRTVVTYVTPGFKG
jgi:hypothetical protein